MPEMTVDELLSTTRAVRRRLDFDRVVGLDVIRKCLGLALQAPTGSNQQGWYFVIVTDKEKRAGLAKLYAKAFDAYRSQGPVAYTKGVDFKPASRRSLETCLHIDTW